MKLRTPIDVEPLGQHIEYHDRLFAIGSCFAQRIGDAIRRAKFKIEVNPTGVLFNPLSICATMERFINRGYVSVEELCEGDLGWFHYDMHSSLNGSTAQGCVDAINETIEAAHDAVMNSKWVIITLGTAWVYELISSGRVVANCHKQPSRIFNRRRVDVEEVVEALQRIVNLLPNKEIILTLSPVRHLADGACDNAISKATLRLAIEKCRASNSNVHYFPAYEIVLDELRDYRFYDDDMAHPSSLAVEYIWERFCQAALSTQSQATLAQVMRVVKAAEHRPYNPRSEAHLRHCEAQLRAIEALSEVDFGEEYEYFNRSLKINS